MTYAFACCGFDLSLVDLLTSIFHVGLGHIRVGHISTFVFNCHTGVPAFLRCPCEEDAAETAIQQSAAEGIGGPAVRSPPEVRPSQVNE